VKQRRIELDLTQRDLAARLAVSEWTVLNWETGLRQPRVTHYPAIIGFLGFDPSRPAKGAEPSLGAIRRSIGVSRRELARRIGVDEGTLRDWERGTRRASRQIEARVATFLASLTQSRKRG